MLILKCWFRELLCSYSFGFQVALLNAFLGYQNSAHFKMFCVEVPLTFHSRAIFFASKSKNILNPLNEPVASMTSAHSRIMLWKS